MNIDIPEIKCLLLIETFASNGSVTSKHSLTDACLKLCRNVAGDCVLTISDKNNKETKRFTFVKKQENYRLNTKFVSEGKCSLLLPDLNLRIFISNCPPNDLSLFLKGFTLKCNYYSKQNTNKNENFLGMMTKQVTSMRNCQNSTIEKISPLTTKDVIRNLALRNQTNTNNMLNLSSPVASKRAFQKRKLENALETITDSSPNTKKRLINSIIPSPVRSLKVLNSNNLTDEQYKVLSAVMHGQSLFFTGSAGTGKSYLLKFIISRLPPDSTFVTASTGIAASHIGGITLHMFAGISANWLEEMQSNTQLTPRDIACRLMKNEAKVQRLRFCKCLVVDEISMVSGDYFELLDQVARIIRNNNKPFGGIQLVLCGDFLQLPPISKKEKSDKNKYSFQTKSWNDSIRYCFELRKIQRQTDPAFIQVLQLLRIGRITESVKSTLIKTSQNNLRQNNAIPTQLYTHRKDVDLINARQLQKLTTQSFIYMANDSDPLHSTMLDSLCPTSRKLELKVGTQVMLNKNIDVNKGLVNGLTGVIIKFERETVSFSSVSKRHFPRIQFVNGVETVIGLEKWMVKLNSENKSICRSHLPLQLAWALSVHKSQGMTITNGVEISLAKVFESGQAYVALSRATSLKNVKIIDFNPRNIIVDNDALNFYKQLKYVS